MFTGIVETVGTIKELKDRGNYRIITIGSDLPSHEIQLGESIACDGPCLTVVFINDDSFVVEASQETLKLTTLGDYKVGRRVNLERALQVGSRLGGHFVSGHIDVAGTVDYIRPVGESQELAVAFDPDFDPYVIDKGSIAINGVSLTVNKSRSGRLSVNMIPHTWKSTALSELKSGQQVNLEFDLIGKYIVKMTGVNQGTGLTKDKLLESGW